MLCLIALFGILKGKVILSRLSKKTNFIGLVDRINNVHLCHQIA